MELRRQRARGRPSGVAGPLASLGGGHGAISTPCLCAPCPGRVRRSRHALRGLGAASPAGGPALDSGERTPDAAASASQERRRSPARSRQGGGAGQGRVGVTGLVVGTLAARSSPAHVFQAKCVSGSLVTQFPWKTRAAAGPVGPERSSPPSPAPPSPPVAPPPQAARATPSCSHEAPGRRRLPQALQQERGSFSGSELALDLRSASGS